MIQFDLHLGGQPGVVIRGGKDVCILEEGAACLVDGEALGNIVSD